MKKPFLAMLAMFAVFVFAASSVSAQTGLGPCPQLRIDSNNSCLAQGLYTETACWNMASQAFDACMVRYNAGMQSGGGGLANPDRSTRPRIVPNQPITVDMPGWDEFLEDLFWDFFLI